MIKKVLIANRGEIAVRVMRSAKEMGIKTVAVYSEADKDAMHVKMSDEAVFIGKAPANESYLQMEKIIEVAKQTKADAIHPGYGFLSENASFSNRCQEEGITFIGPSAHAIATMGDKITARKSMIKAGVRIVPGYQGNHTDDDTLLIEAKKIGYPIMVKATAGGGGKGMRLVHKQEDLLASVHAAAAEAKAAFGNALVYLEKYIASPHHIEFQILADNYENVVHLNERECSVQRRHQKVIEETPSPLMTDEVRHKMGEQAKQAALAVNYAGAGTIEFLVDDDLNYYFLEMNTRLQVEHPITEMTTGVDLVKEQFKIAAGEKLSYKQEDIPQNGHAIECRIYAENPENNFMPSAGKLLMVKEPKGENIRVDGYVYSGYEIPIYYDPMISKLIVWDKNRSGAIKKMHQALHDYKILGVEHNIAFLDSVLSHPKFIEGQYDTRFIGLYEDDLKLGSIYNIDLAAFAVYVQYQEAARENMQRLFPDNDFNIPELHVKINDDIYKMQVLQRMANQYKVKINDTDYLLNINRLDDNTLQINFNEKSFEIISLAMQPKKYICNIGLHNFEASVIDQQTHYAQNRKSGESLSNGNQIVSPIPGKIVKIPVSVGEQIPKDTTVIVVEAMKMQSEYKADSDKIVKAINVQEGDAVEGNQVLVTLEDV